MEQRTEAERPGTVHDQPVRCELDKYDLPGMPVTQLIWLKDEANGIRLGVLPAAGGEITSFQVRIAECWYEILHHALDYRSWPCDASDERAPLLWPAVGRSFTEEQIAEREKTGNPLTQNRYRVGNAAYDIDVHGFARKLPWQLDAFGCIEGSAYATCSLSSSGGSLKIYPFRFEVSVTYRLGGGDICLEYQVLAGDNPCPMPFSIGNHISLRMPFTGKGRFDECTLRTPGNVILQQDPLCLLSGDRTQVDLSSPASLGRKELLDTVLGGFKHELVWLELTDPASMRLRVSHRERNVNGKSLAAEEDFFFVFWGDPALQYFCPEPWIGKPNSLNTRDGCVCLQPGERFVWEIHLQPIVEA